MKNASLLLLFVSLSAFAQQGTQRAPDCNIPFKFTAGSATSLPAFDNRLIACNTWTLSYSAYNASAVSILINSAPDAGNTPGTFSAFSSLLTNTSYAITTVSAFVPWVQVSGTFTFSAGGFVQGTVVGWRPGPIGGGGGGGGSTGTNSCVSNFAADPTGATDSTVALQNCINSLAPGGTNDGGFVIIPPSTSPNFYYLCTGLLTWGSGGNPVIHGKIVLQTGAALQGCALPGSTSATWVDDQTTSSLTVWGTLATPSTTTQFAQAYQICNSAAVCQVLSYGGTTGPAGYAQLSPIGLWYTSVAIIPASYGSGQVAAIGSSGSPVTLYTTPASPPNLQNYEFCVSLTALNTPGPADLGNVVFTLGWTDVAANAETWTAPVLNVGTKSINAGGCYPITPKAATAITFYTTYSSSGTAQYGVTGFLKPE